MLGSVDVPLQASCSAHMTLETLLPTSPPCATYPVPNPSDTMSLSNNLATSWIPKSLSSGGGDENVYPGRDGTTRWYGSSAGLWRFRKMSNIGRNSRKLPVEVRLTGAAKTVLRLTGPTVTEDDRDSIFLSREESDEVNVICLSILVLDWSDELRERVHVPLMLAPFDLIRHVSTNKHTCKRTNRNCAAILTWQHSATHG